MIIMKNYRFITIFLLLVLVGCSSDNGNDAEERFPFMANIEYRVSSAVDDATAELMYINENKDAAELQNEALPFIFGFDVEVEFGDEFYITALTSSSNLKVALFIDGSLIREVEGSNVDNNSESIVHQFGIVDVTSILR